MGEKSFISCPGGDLCYHAPGTCTDSDEYKAVVAEWDRNPSAFPCVGYGPGGDRYMQDGMRLRDWFAGQALATVIQAMQREPAWHPERSLILAAKGAYIVADAMLAERAKAGA